MKIVDHWLQEPDEGIELARRPTARATGPVIKPRLLLIHYAVTDSLEATVAAQVHSTFEAHLSIDGFKEGGRSRLRVTQLIPFNRRGAHAGESRWRPTGEDPYIDGVNSCSVGIEIANPGPLKLHSEGVMKTTYGKTWTEENVYTGRHKNSACPFQYWAEFTEEESDLVSHIGALLKETYGIEDVVGHDDVSPGRKIDPGPAFPMLAVRKAIFGDPLEGLGR